MKTPIIPLTPWMKSHGSPEIFHQPPAALSASALAAHWPWWAAGWTSNENGMAVWISRWKWSNRWHDKCKFTWTAYVHIQTKCTYVYIFWKIYIHRYIYIYICIDKYIYIYIYIFFATYTNTNTNTYTYIYIYTYIHIYIYTYIHFLQIYTST